MLEDVAQNQLRGYVHLFIIHSSIKIIVNYRVVIHNEQSSGAQYLPLSSSSYQYSPGEST